MSNNTLNYQEYTFPKLLKQYDKILIPMIQRDYAQGRTDKKATDVRNNLLTDIFSGKKVYFDLVFGSKEKRIIDGIEMNCFIPVDGQQRLTTLFLLYLYGQKKLNSFQELDLSKFSYDTRRAASDFCKCITSEEWSVPNGNNVSKVIKDSFWFMNYWEKDPTVEGMLNMLDAIHEKCKEPKDYPKLEKVTFFFFDLESNGLNENLYLKMNSRGKPLTAFENLKAKMEKLLPEDVEFEDKCFPECDASPKDSFKAKWKYFMDRNWTEAFWDSANPENYDVSIAKFIARFLAGYWAAFGKETTEKTTAKDLKEVNRKEQNDKNYSDYILFEPIKAVLELDDAFPSCAYALTTAPQIAPYWPNDTIKVSDRGEYKFLAVILTYVLFEGGKDAMRFAWNMAENDVTDYGSFVTYCKRVGAIRDFKRDNNLTFYQALSSIEFVDNTSDQMKEEIAKAKQILSNETSWEDKIIEAEKYAFFKGAIRFLFTKEEIGDDWEHFDTKWTNAQKYFDENGVKDGSKKYKSNALLIKSLLANGDWNNIWWHFELSNDANRWKRILISDKWRNAVDAIMYNEVTTEITKKNIKNQFIKNIVDGELMDYVCTNESGAWIRSTYHNYHAIWKSGYPSRQIVLNSVLAQLKDNKSIEYSEKNKIENCRYYKCVDKNVDFKYCSHFFRWCYPNEKVLDVYLMENDWADYKKRPNPTSDIGTDEDIYYCFRVTEDMECNTDKFIEALNILIKQLPQS